jgi:hypothetical protein
MNMLLLLPALQDCASLRQKQEMWDAVLPAAIIEGLKCSDTAHRGPHVLMRWGWLS